MAPSAYSAIANGDHLARRRRTKYLWTVEINLRQVEEAARAYGEERECDILLQFGQLDSKAYNRLRQSVSGGKRKNVLLVPITWGGDAHTAYRIGRFLQREYERVLVLVPGPCKSAGTLLAVAGHELAIGDDGELGPIDVQRVRQDDLWERASGLIESSALESLGQVTWDLFEKLVTEIKDMSYGGITFKTAAEAAAPIVTGVLSPIASQIDPLKVGETARALQIAAKYANNLGRSTSNLQQMAISRLATGYPDHGFIIDREEAKTLFRNVSAPEGALLHLSNALADCNPEVAASMLLNHAKEPGTEKTEQEEESEVQVGSNGIARAEDRAASSNGDVADVAEDPTGDREDGVATRAG